MGLFMVSRSTVRFENMRGRSNDAKAVGMLDAKS
jgi:hypothetical protein